MQTTTNSAAKTQGDAAHAEPMKFSKRIGSTVYTVAVHHNQTGRETIQDKLLRLIEQEVSKIA
jgi:hypothetical protein